MPRKQGLRDDDVLGRLADIERRLDALEPDQKPKPKDKPKE